MHSFLNGIAEAYIADPDLRASTFVFPNVRSKRYFNEYVASRLGVEPRDVSSLCLTLAELIEKACPMEVAPSERLVFILYRAYCNVMQGRPVETFDRFRFWGQMILKDFNDVDRYLADPKELFRNARDYKKIQAFYLTPAQEEIIRAYWGSDPYWQAAFKNREEADELPFWNHITMKGEPERKFTQLWAVLGELYNEFRRLLALSGECYPGMACRYVAEQLMFGNRLPFNPKRYVFIGFNRLSHAEAVIFRQLHRAGLAHFYWDYDPTLMNHRETNTAARFIKSYVEEFRASLPGVNLGNDPAVHEVKVIAVPSAMAQAKVAAGCLHGDDTALILADSELLLPTVASIPDSYAHVNVTMGLPVRFTSLAQLFDLIIAMQLRARFSSDGDVLFFHDDVVALMAHPAVQRAFPAESGELVQHMRRQHLYNLPLSALTDGFDVFRPLFAPSPKSAGPEEIAAHLIGLLRYFASAGMLSELDLICLDDLIGLVERVTAYASEFEVEADRRTFYEMILHSMRERTLPLEGEAFDAMQVMGMLETRGLGFPNVVMLSMNDEVFPGSDSSYSFIPETLRRAYGLPTRDHLEADAAYNFYRILSHARTMTILYDARCGGLRSGRVSRYVTQLLYADFPGVRISEVIGEFLPPSTECKPLIAPGYRMQKAVFAETLARYAEPDHINTHRLSASDLKEYLNCPLQFFLCKINDINPPELEREETGAADHGNVVHEVAQRIYTFLARRGDDVPVTRADLDDLVDGGFDRLLDRELTRAVNIHFMHYPARIDGEENRALENIPLDDKNSLYASAIRISLLEMFRKEHTPFRILATELPVMFSWPVAEGLSVNFKMIIDRLDCVAEGNQTIYRIIDYKTGGDATALPSIDSLFEIGNPKQRKAIFQLLVYCAAFLQQNPGIDARCVRPMIYKLKEMEGDSFPPLKLGEGRGAPALESYAMVRGEFEKGLADMFRDIFNVDKEVERACDPDCCRFCPFAMMCN